MFGDWCLFVAGQQRDQALPPDRRYHRDRRYPPDRRYHRDRSYHRDRRYLLKAVRSQSRADCALVIVSSVVKVFGGNDEHVSPDEIAVASTKSIPSTFETNRKLRFRSL